MSQYKFVLCLSLLYRLTVCHIVNEIASSSEVPVTEESDVIIGKNLTEQFARDKDEHKFLLGNTTSALSNIENDEHWNLDRLLEVWNPIAVSRIWKKGTYRNAGVSLSCDQELTRYMTGVSRKRNWALKMMDADGKRTWGTFSDNRYWIGDVDQCRRMENGFVEWQKEKDNTQRSEELPPFRVSVNSINIALEILKPGLNGTQNITLGLCMPIACDTRDIESLLYFAQEQFSVDFPWRITVNHVRNLSKGYTFWDDTTFYILLISFVVVSVFVLTGTSYDVAQRYKILREANKNNNNIVTTESKLMRPDSSLDHQFTITKLWTVTTHIGSLDVRNPKVVPRPLSESLLSFSLLVNVSKLCSLDVGSDTLAPIHGLKFYTMLWIILIHTCLITNEISDNKMFRKAAEGDFLYQIIGNGAYSVNTFFFVSGCLVAFLYYRTMAHKKLQERKVMKGCRGKVLQFLAMMWYRYFRLTPIYLLVIGLIQVSMKWYHDHSMIELTSLDHKTCERFWWRNALYINTYFKLDERCVTWTWYLANDTQFYTVGIIILIIGASFLPIAAFIAAFFLIASWITTAIITLSNRHVPSIQDPFAHYDSLYDKPWIRIGPYLVGMATGWYLFKIDCRTSMNKAVVILGWSLSLLTMTSIVCGLHGTAFGPVLSVLYTALSHSGWAICLAWILTACVTGHGGIANHILSWKYLYPLSRLTFCTYLIHPALLRAMILQAETSWHLTQGFMAFLFFGTTVVSFAVSLFLSLLFEAPMVSLLRIVHPLREWKRQR